ncbi:DciA family protein [Psychromonas marina]|nr:DciA family protein [Psychromonas marina]
MNRSRQPKPMAQLLKKSELQYNQPLFTKLDSLLQSFLKQHNIDGCRLGNLQNGSLLIEIPNATWMVRLQFMRNDLLSLLRQASPGLLKINIKVNPRLSITKNIPKKNKNRVKKRASKMPSDVADSFLAMADDAEPALKKALQSLAQFSKK